MVIIAGSNEYDTVALHAIAKWRYLSTRAIFLLYQFMKADVSRLNVR